VSTHQGDWDVPHPSWRQVSGTRNSPVFIGPCGKKVYRSYTHAASDAKRLRDKQDNTGHPSAYWCVKCRGFHTGRLYGPKHH
jgi:hypothetical protein